MISRADVAAGILLQPHRFAFDDVLEADLAGDFGQNRNAVRIPLAEHLRRLDLLVLLDEQCGAGGNLVLFQFAALRVEKRDFAVAREDDVLAFFVRDHAHAGELDDAALLGLGLALFDARVDRTADVERTHRQLRARLADALGGDDADGHAFFDQRAGRQVHAVAAAGRRPSDASQVIGAADLNLLQAQFLDLAGDLRRDQFVLADDHFVGDGIDDVLPADAAVDRRRPSGLRPFRRGR